VEDQAFQHNIETHGFAQVECDITIEQTFNRDSKTKGGLTGFTQNKAAVHRWILSQPARAFITKECKSFNGWPKPRGSD
jgi:hypothetical protein